MFKRLLDLDGVDLVKYCTFCFLQTSDPGIVAWA